MAAVEEALTQSMVSRGKQVLERTAAAVSERINDRVASLERDAAVQLRELAKVQESSRITARQIDAAADAVRQTLDGVSSASPGTVAPALNRSTWGPELLSHSEAVMSAPARETALVRQKVQSRSRYLCPNCSTADLRQSERNGFWEEFLGLFFIRPLRCQRCLRRYFRF